MAWIALVPLPPEATFAPTANISAESANRETEVAVLRVLMQPPHCCTTPSSASARVLLLPFHFTAALHSARCRKPGGMERLAAAYRLAADHVASSHATRRKRHALPLVVVASNSAAFDAAGPGFPWSHLPDGSPPAGLVRVAPELRYKAGPVGVKLRSATQGFPAGLVVAAPPFGFVADRVALAGRAGSRRPLSLGHEIASRVRTHLGVSSTKPPTLAVGGSGVPISSSSHPILQGFVVIPYGSVHPCLQHSRAVAAADRPLLASFIGCVASPTPWRLSPTGSLWGARQMLANGLRSASRVKIVDTCAARSGRRSFALATAWSLYQRSRFCLAPPGDVVSTSRLFDGIYHGCIPVATSEALVLPFAHSLPWDECVLWHPITSTRDVSLMLSRLYRAAANDTEMLRRGTACALIRDRVTVWRAESSGGCSSGTVGSELLRRLHDPTNLIQADWAATLHSIGAVRQQSTP
ncbi:hypothetical protein AB1Y20_020389 [Prymnesium parvum]